MVKNPVFERGSAPRTTPLAKINRTGKMPIPQKKITLVGWASCPSHQLMKMIFARGLLTWLNLSIRQDLRLVGPETGLMGENNCFQPADSVKNLLVERSRNPVSRSRSASRRAIINYSLSMPNSQFPITDYFRRSSNLR